MRLLHTSTLELCEFSVHMIPEYAILSHTWGDDEFLFSDFQKDRSARTSGFDKIGRCCELAASEGWQYVWIDTCCIDKSSSAELSESINSMFRWYRESAICYVYLSDFSLGSRHPLHESRWFRRGWTLQELLAPSNVVFFDQHWVEVGSKAFLEQKLSQICSISTNHLKNPFSASIAARMSWAARRETSREEDLAYSLLGLFNIHMPLIYGEGANAFRRLQLEIIASSDDESIFAWMDEPLVESGLLARRPAAFSNSGDLVPQKFVERSPYFMSNKGLSIGLKASNPKGLKAFNAKGVSVDVMYCPLNCTKSTNSQSPVLLVLETYSAASTATRIHPDEIEFFSEIHGWADLKDVHLFISERILHGLLPSNKAPHWLPTAIQPGPCFLQKNLTILDIQSKQRLATATNASKYVVTPSDAFIVSGYTALTIVSPYGLEAVLWWASGIRAHLSQAWPRTTDFLSLCSAKAGEELEVRPADSHNGPESWVFVKDIFSGVLRRSKPIKVGASSNATISRKDGTFLWLRTRQEYVGDYHGYWAHCWRVVVDIDVTTVDRSKILESV